MSVRPQTGAVTVLNPWGRDAPQAFPDGAGAPSTSLHPPVNYHAYAACTGGSFERDPGRAAALGRPVLLLLRRDLRACCRALESLKAAGLTVAVTLKETGFHQFHRLLAKPGRLVRFRRIVRAADGVVSPTRALVPVFRALRAGLSPETVRFIVTPYPVDDPQWDFSVPIERRRGLFIGTRDLDVPSRNHLQSLILAGDLARRLACPVGMVTREARVLRRMLEGLAFPVDRLILRPPMPYSDYLRFMAPHRIVFQLDESMVPGQVAGDACLCRLVCVGGNGSVESLVFPDTASRGQNWGELVEHARKLLEDDAHYRPAVEAAVRRARDTIAYEVIAPELRGFLASLAG